MEHTPVRVSIVLETPPFMSRDVYITLMQRAGHTAAVCGTHDVHCVSLVCIVLVCCALY